MLNSLGCLTLGQHKISNGLTISKIGPIFAVNYKPIPTTGKTDRLGQKKTHHRSICGGFKRVGLTQGKFRRLPRQMDDQQPAST